MSDWDDNWTGDTAALARAVDHEKNADLVGEIASLRASPARVERDEARARLARAEKALQEIADMPGMEARRKASGRALAALEALGEMDTAATVPPA